MNVLQRGWIPLVSVLFSSVLVAWQNTPQALQASGIARLDRYRDHVRRTGDQRSLLGELEIAARELETSYRGFTAESNHAQAAWSLVKLGDCERLALISVLTTAQTQAGDQRAGALARSSRGHYEMAAALARKTGSNAYLVQALLGLARIDTSHEHDYGSANARVTEALRAASGCRDKDCFLDALLTKVEVESARGELFSAASHVNGLLALLKSDSDPNRPYFAYSDRASIYEGMADGCSYNSQKSAEVCFRLFDLAKTDYSKARDLATQNGLPYFARISEEGIQRLNLLRNLTEMRQSALSKIPATVRFDPKSPKDVLVTEFISTGQVSPQAFQAVNAYRQAAGRALPGYLGIWVQAQMDEMQGRTDAALEGYLRAIQTVEEDRRKLGEDSARSAFLNDKIDIYDRPILFLLKSKRYAEAFDLLERSRARATMDLLSTRSLGLSKPVDRKLFATLALKRAEIASLQTHFFNEALSSENQADDPQSVMAAQTHLAELEAAYEDFLLRIAREAPRVRDVAVSRPVSIETVQSALRQDSTDLLYYHLLDYAVILIHIGPNSFHVRNVFLPRFQLISKVAALRDSMRKRDAAFREDLAKELFLYLIQPALGWLSGDKLAIIPQADLQSLPFQVFEDPASGSFLGERFQITYAPNASILLQLKKQRNLASGSLLAACDPSLPGAPEEVKTLARFYPGRQKVVTDSLIRKTDLKQWAGSYDILHLAVHGEFDSQEPLLSKVQLAGGTAGDGDLTAAEMFGLPLDNTRIATLSACETGRVRTTRSNEIQGIVQALLFAGAQSVLVSAWKVDSTSTSVWMRTFYREAQSRTPAEAAREAIREVRRRPEYSHPFYWAPFLLIAR